jgi:hypothetical protein
MPIGPIGGDCIDDISSRGGRNSGISFLGNHTIKILAVDPSFAKPPEFYEYDRSVDYVYIGNHFGFEFQLTFYMNLKGSADVPNFGYWRWTYLCDVNINYPDGYVFSQTVSLGTDLIDPLVYNFKEVSFPITFSTTTIFNPQGRVNLTEDDTYGYYPPHLTLDLYEIIPSGTTPSISVTVQGLDGATVTSNAHVLTTNATTEYDYTISTKLHASGASAGVQPLQINNLTLNELALPDYTYLHVIDSNNYFYQTTGVDAKVQGSDNAFGDPVYNEITAVTSVIFERNVKNKGIVNSWQSSFPDDLDVVIDSFDYTGRTVNFTGSFDQTNLFQRYQFDSNIKLAGVDNFENLAFDNLPSGYISNTITQASLYANGDYIEATRLPFRAWSKPGADIYHIKNTVLAGTGNSRTYPNGYSFASYRYLDVTAGNATTVPQNGKVTISQNGTNTILDYDVVWPAGTATTRIDLCFAGIAHTTFPFPNTQSQDNPYPRINFIWGDLSGTGRTINQDMYGIGQIQNVIATGNITVSQFKLTRNDNTGKASLIAPFSAGQGSIGNTSNGFFQWQTNSPTRVFLGRRFWEQDVDGKNEEEYDLSYEYLISQSTPIVTDKLNVEGLCNNIQNRVGRMPNGNNYTIHTGWQASASYSGAGSSAYLTHRFDKFIAYASWLNGNGLQYLNGVSNYSILRDLSQESGDRDIYTQMIFDRINTTYPPDYFDAFGIETPGETSLILNSFSCLRSVGHGLVQQSQLGQNVRYETNTGFYQGEATTDVLGGYQTGLPGGTGQINTRINFNANLVNIPTAFNAKRNRGAFYYVIAPDANIISADISGFYQHLIGYDNSGTLTLILSDTHNFSNFIYLNTNIINIQNGAVRWKTKTDENQIIATIEDLVGSVKRYEIANLITGVAGMATTLGTGTQPALAINKNGYELHFFRTTDSGGSIKRVGIDNVGQIVVASSIVVTGNVTTNGLAAYWYDDVPYLVYSHATNGITVLSSQDYGITFS